MRHARKIERFVQSLVYYDPEEWSERYQIHYQEPLIIAGSRWEFEVGLWPFRMMIWVVHRRQAKDVETQLSLESRSLKVDIRRVKSYHLLLRSSED